MKQTAETRLFRAYWGDGALDLIAGVGVALIGVGYLFEQMLAPVVVVPLAFAAWFILRSKVVEPRAGYVEFARRRRQRSAREAAGAVAAGLGVLALVGAIVAGLGGGASTVDQWVDALPAFLVAVAALVAAGLTRSVRFAAYAALLAAAGAAAVAVETGPAIPFLVGGSIVFVTGAVLLARFVAESRSYREEG